MLGTLLRAKRGEASPDELLELLQIAGIQAKVKRASAADAIGILEETRSARVKTFVLDGKTADGQQIVAIMVLPVSEP